jgi:hypothetical protein
MSLTACMTYRSIGSIGVILQVKQRLENRRYEFGTRHEGANLIKLQICQFTTPLFSFIVLEAHPALAFDLETHRDYLN